MRNPRSASLRSELQRVASIKPRSRASCAAGLTLLPDHQHLDDPPAVGIRPAANAVDDLEALLNVRRRRAPNFVCEDDPLGPLLGRRVLEEGVVALFADRAAFVEGEAVF